MAKKTKTPTVADNLRHATNHAHFATFYGRKKWELTLDTGTERQAVLTGDTDEMLKGLIGSQEKFDSLGIEVLGKKTDTGLIVHFRPKKVAT